MSQLYGDTSFQIYSNGFDRIYSNRKEMDTDVEPDDSNLIEGSGPEYDGVGVGRFVIIQYTTEPDPSVDFEEGSEFSKNLQEDMNKYGSSGTGELSNNSITGYHATIWQKAYDETNHYYYMYICSLDSKLYKYGEAQKIAIDNLSVDIDNLQTQANNLSNAMAEGGAGLKISKVNDKIVGIQAGLITPNNTNIFGETPDIYLSTDNTLDIVMDEPQGTISLSVNSSEVGVGRKINDNAIYFNTTSLTPEQLQILGEKSFSINDGQALGQYCFSGGEYAQSYNDYAFSFGFNTYADTNALAFGQNAEAINNSFAFGTYENSETKETISTKHGIVAYLQGISWGGSLICRVLGMPTRSNSKLITWLNANQEIKYDIYVLDKNNYVKKYYTIENKYCKYDSSNQDWDNIAFSFEGENANLSELIGLKLPSIYTENTDISPYSWFLLIPQETPEDFPTNISGIETAQIITQQEFQQDEKDYFFGGQANNYSLSFGFKNKAHNHSFAFGSNNVTYAQYSGANGEDNQYNFLFGDNNKALEASYGFIMGKSNNITGNIDEGYDYLISNAGIIGANNKIFSEEIPQKTETTEINTVMIKYSEGSYGFSVLTVYEYNDDRDIWEWVDADTTTLNLNDWGIWTRNNIFISNDENTKIDNYLADCLSDSSKNSFNLYSESGELLKVGIKISAAYCGQYDGDETKYYYYNISSLNNDSILDTKEYYYLTPSNYTFEDIGDIGITIIQTTSIPASRTKPTNTYLLGHNLLSTYPNQYILGHYNKNKEDVLFAVGNGNSEDNRRNIFEILQDGSINIKNNINIAPGQIELFPENALRSKSVDSTFEIDLIQLDYSNSIQIGGGTRPPENIRLNTKNQADGDVIINGIPYAQNKVLWQGNHGMNAEQTITLSKGIDKQAHGIILVFSPYKDDKAKNSDFHSFFIPKQLIAEQDGKGHNFIMMQGPSAAGTDGTISRKYLYIYNQEIEGNAMNISTQTVGNVSFNNVSFVLRYVIGV